jgi:Tol biopolymer transport system component
MRDTRDDGETVAGETSLGKDDTVQANDLDAAAATPRSIVRTGRTNALRTKLGRYRILSRIGRGGMGEVFEAEDPELGRKVAIKVLREDRAHAPALLKEAQALARLVHPNVITIHDVGTDEGHVFLVMQLVEGVSIDTWARTTKPSARTIVATFRQAGLGLAAAHAAGLVHCDIKPANILVDHEGIARVGDFGLARTAGADEQIAGTPAYMAPEQFTGAATAASDQFSFCASLWEVLAGQRLFAESTLDDAATAAARRTRAVMPRARRVPTRIARALERGLSTDPKDRFADMHALLEALAPPRWHAYAFIGAGAAAVAAAIVALSIARGAPRAAAPVAAMPPPAPTPPRLDAAHARNLTNGGKQQCAYAPTAVADGTVVYDRTVLDAVDLYSVPLAGGVPKQLTSAPTWEWRSSRGRRAGEVIHLTNDMRTNVISEIAALDLATGSDTRLFEVLAHDAAVAGDAVFYVPQSQTELRMRKGGKDKTIVGGGPHHFDQFAVSPHGDWLAIVGLEKQAFHLCLVEVESAKMTCLADEMPSSRPAFGVDGRNVYYASLAGIRRHDMTTGADVMILPGVSATGGITVTPDGAALIYSDCGPHSSIVDAAAPDRPIVNDFGARDPAFAADGSLAWTRLAGKTRVLVARKPNGEELQLTRQEFGDVTEPAFSPDGISVAFVGGKSQPGIHIAQMVPGRSVVTVTDSPRDSSVFWTDDYHLAFARTDDSAQSRVFVIRADGSDLKQVAAGQLRGVARGQLFVTGVDYGTWIDVTTGKHRSEPPHPAESVGAVIAPSGRWMAFEAGSVGQDIWRLRLDPPGKLEKIGSSPTGVTQTTFAVSDEGLVLTSQTTWNGDLTYVPAAPGTKL